MTWWQTLGVTSSALCFAVLVAAAAWHLWRHGYWRGYRKAVRDVRELLPPLAPQSENDDEGLSR